MRDAAHQGRRGHRDEAIVTLLYDTGLRRAELSCVDRRLFEFDGEVLRLPGGPTVQNDYRTGTHLIPRRSRWIQKVISELVGHFDRIYLA